MRIEFANAARDGLAWTGPLLRIGQAADNDLVLDDAGVAAHHLSLRRMPGTLVLEVEPGAGRVYVNARPVHERALLRAGDSLGVGKCRLRLCAEATVADDDDAETPEVPLTVALRAVAGPLSGRVMPLDDRLELGPRGHFPLDLPHGDEAALAVVRRDDGLYLDADRVPAELALFVNGRATRDTPLHDGDQIALGAHRFVIDAWVPSRTRVHAAREVFLPHEADLPEDTAGPRGEVWWLIVTAAVLGLAIALLLFVRF
jgi:pSer/pThr/pTyr-binding forkhead associated (FHA) protein